MQLFGIHLVGLTRANLHKLLLTVGFLAAILLFRFVVLWVLERVARGRRNERIVFWIRQASAVLTAVLVLLAVLSIWFNDPSHAALPLGLLSAGLAFALQKVITSFAGYVVILRGKTFSVGDRIAMGGVRGDVIALGFFQTQIMEMGQPAGVGDDSDSAPKTWVHGRQYTGRVVTVTNDKVFDEPVYNFTREFPFLWEEIRIPIDYKSDRAKVEEILLRAAEETTSHVRRLSVEERREMEEHYVVNLHELDPRVFVRLTDNWVEMALRFVTKPNEARAAKDKMSRRILGDLEKAGIGIASSTYDVVGFPPLKLDDDSLQKLARALSTSRAGRESRPSLS